MIDNDHERALDAHAAPSPADSIPPAVREAMLAAGFKPRAIPVGLAYDSPLTLPDGTVVVVYAMRLVGALLAFCDVEHELSSAGLDTAPVRDLVESYRMEDRYPGMSRLVHDREGAQAFVAAAWDVVGYQIAAYAYAQGKRDASAKDEALQALDGLTMDEPGGWSVVDALAGDPSAD